jgi:transcriptional regulator with XRE-family HTH domain
MDTPTRRILASNVRRLRAQRQWSQTQLAVRAGIAQTVISYCEREDGKSPTLDTIEALANAFHVPVWALLIETDALDPAHINALAGIVKTYTTLPDSGQEQLSRVADAEARYAKGG